MKILSLLLVNIFLFLSLEMAIAQNNSTVLVNVGVVLDMDKYIAKMGLSCISMALSDFYSSHYYYKTRIFLHTRDSKDDVVVAAAAALDLLKNVQVRAIIGPITSMQADFMINLGTKAQVPIISYSATSPSLSSIRNPYFIRAAQNDSSQVKCISAIIQSFGWRRVVPIYVDNEFGNGMVPSLVDALEDIDARVPHLSVIPQNATEDEIKEELHKLMKMQTRVFVVHMPPSLASRFFTQAKVIGMISEGYVWILTDAVTNQLSSMDASEIYSMQGVLGVMPYLKRTKKLHNFEVRWKTKFHQGSPSIHNANLNAFGIWAYDAATALAVAVEEVIGNIKTGYQNSTDLATFGISQIGPQLLQALQNTILRGLSGDFYFINGQLNMSVYQIVNVFGDGCKVVGFWTLGNGIVKELVDLKRSTTYNTSNGNFGTIVWPGDSKIHPKGWEIPTNGKELRVGVPIKYGFTEFVKATNTSETNKDVTGYSIDVFEAVMSSLPYSYKYFPFNGFDPRSQGYYNTLVEQVYRGNYDMVVGDVTIIANRLNYVDFTLPYSESGITMIVPLIDKEKKSPWLFLKPLTWDLWVTAFGSFMLVGFVVWVLEHRINEEFRGPPLHQAGLIPWFSFSTMVSAHKNAIVSNLARFVLIIWCFVVLILTQSYTANLSSMLTVQRLQPTVTDVDELKNKGEHVGYQEGSFVIDFLIKQKGFDSNKLVKFSSIEELDKLFSNGSIAAAFDEIPFMKLFISKNCSKYSMVPPTYKIDGFGFVLPIDSPMVHEVSSQILKVTEGEIMDKIEKEWFGNTSCPDSSTSISSNSLGLESFWGLILIAGIASFSALIIFTCTFVNKHKHILRQLPPEASIWRKIKKLGQEFDKKDSSSHTFRKSEFRQENGIDIIECVRAQEIPPDAPHDQGRSSISLDTARTTNGPPSPSNISNGTSVDGTPCHENGISSSHGPIKQEIVLAFELSDPNHNRHSEVIEFPCVGHQS